MVTPAAAPFLTSLLWCCDLVREDELREAILIIGVGIGDVGFGFGQFRLAEFHNGREAEVVASLREIERERSLFAHLASNAQPLVTTIGVLPGYSYVPSDVV